MGGMWGIGEWGCCGWYGDSLAVGVGVGSGGIGEGVVGRERRGG